MHRCYVCAEKRDLAFALVSRVLTTKEMEQVKNYGIDLYTQDMVPYNDLEVTKKLNDALLQQFKLRIAAEKGCKP